MKKSIPFVLLIFFSSCIGLSHIAQTSGLNEDDLSLIPKDASEVIIEKDIPALEMYNEIYSSLLLRGHRIDKDDKERYYITTEGKDVGQSTLQRSTIVINENNGTSKAIIRSEWKPGTTATMGTSMFAGIALSTDWEQAKWETGRPGIAFAEGYSIAKSVNGKVSFR